MRRSTTKTIILAVLLGFIAAAAGVGVRLYTAWNSKGETLIDAAKKSAENSASYDALESQGKFNILLMGEDNVDGSRRSDTILFITVDIDDKNIRVLSLPRDTRVMIPGHGTQKLNHAFAYGGQDLMRATVTNYLGEPILYYMIVDYDSFPAFVDMLGGVEIDVPKRMRYVDRAGGLDINIQPGLQTLDGKTALHFVRFRKDALGDIGRIQRQQQFLKAMLKRAYDPRVIIRLPELAAQAMKIFRTDMSTSFALQLAGFIQNEVGRDKMLFSTLRGTPATIDGLSYWMGDVRDAKRFLNAPFEELTGEKTEAGEGGAGEQQPAEDEKAEKPGMTAEQLAELVKSMPESVAVLNGTGKSGVAGEISTRLQKIGVDVVHTGNAKHFDYRYSNIVYPSDAPSSVKDTAKTLGKLLRIRRTLKYNRTTEKEMEPGMADKKDFCAPYKKLIDALIDKHALEVTAHDLSEVSGFADIFIVAIARSELHGRTLKDTAMDTLDEMGFSYRIEGETSTKWTLLDAGDLIVNILSREGRDFYRLDSLWGDAPTERFFDEDE